MDEAIFFFFAFKQRQIYRNWAILKSMNQKCIETYFRFMCLLLHRRRRKKKETSFKGITATKESEEKREVHHYKKYREFENGLLWKAHSLQIESNDGFIRTVIGKQADSKCVFIFSFFSSFQHCSHWLPLEDHQPEKHLSSVCLARCPLMLIRFEFTWYFHKKNTIRIFRFEINISKQVACAWKQQTWTHFCFVWIKIIIFKQPYDITSKCSPTLNAKIWFFNERSVQHQGQWRILKHNRIRCYFYFRISLTLNIHIHFILKKS